MLKVSVVHSVRSRKFLAALTALVSVVAMLVGARVAVADSVWVQSYERTSQTQACAAQPGETPWQAAWGTDSRWTPSWEQWANAGKGGWTCTRSITWAQTPVASSGSGGSSPVTYAVGDTGPGDGLVFYIDSTSGLRYEMAPKTWSGAGTPDAGETYCDGFTDVPAAIGTVVGTGAANTAAMAASSACSSNAAAAVLAYAPAGTSAGQWFLPSKDELNAMCNYSRNPTAPSAPSVSCYGGSGSTQNGTFAAGTYGFASGGYWSSSQFIAYNAWSQYLGSGYQDIDVKTNPLRVRPIRAF